MVEKCNQIYRSSDSECNKKVHCKKTYLIAFLGHTDATETTKYS